MTINISCNCNELIANDVVNLKDDMQPNEVIANDDSNFEGYHLAAR
jgi:hypothetical protein